jgi:hypothetical protein
MRAQQELGRECRVIKPQMYFIPYYRLTGNDFRWEEAPREPVKQDTECGQSAETNYDHQWEYEDKVLDFDTLFRLAGDLIDIVRGKPSTLVGQGRLQNATVDDMLTRAMLQKNGPQGSDFEEPGKVQLADRYVEKNFIACNLHGEGLYSLGLRPTVLRLQLFRRNNLESLGKVVPPDLGINEAVSNGMKDAGIQPLLFRTVIGRILSIIYFPFWVIEMESQGNRLLAIVDGVSQSALKLDAETSIYSVLDRVQQAEPQTVGFRPLGCPNCGWDLPLRPDDAIFFCSSCARAWQIYGSDLKEVPYQIAQVDNISGPLKHLPFWVLTANTDSAEPFTFYIPAFRFRRLKLLADLATNITRKKPVYSICGDEKQEMKDMQGCYYDAEDAFLVAQFIQAGITSKTPEEMRSFNKNKLSLQSAALIWVPFKINGGNLVDPFSGMSIAQGLLL